MAKASMYITLDETVGKHGTKELKRQLDALPGVLSVSLGDGGSSVTVDFDTTGTRGERIKKQIAQMGCGIREARLEQGTSR